MSVKVCEQQFFLLVIDTGIEHRVVSRIVPYDVVHASIVAELIAIQPVQPILLALLDCDEYEFLQWNALLDSCFDFRSDAVLQCPEYDVVSCQVEEVEGEE